MKNKPNDYARWFVRFLNRINLKLRPKLILIFVILTIIPIFLMTTTAWNQIVSLGQMLRDIAVEDSTKALNNGARENIERMTTDIAASVADFLSQRDRDVLLLANLTPSDQTCKMFSENRLSTLTMQGEWILSKDGMSWVTKDPYINDRPAVSSSNKENNDELYGSSFLNRAADYFSQESKPLYDEITFLDLNGNEIYKYVNPDSTKRNYPLNPNKVNVSNRANTYVKAETYFAELEDLRPGEIYVSDVIGAYVGTNYIGMYTPGVLLNDVPDTHPNYDLLQEIARLPEEDFVEAAKTQAFAGKENPVGRRFEGIVRWATPVTNEQGGIIGYVTMALNHDHIMEFVDYVMPMHERYTELPSAYEGNYAFIWDYQCRSICHPRHHSIVGYNPVTGEPQVPWLEGTLDYERDYINGGFLKDESGNKILVDGADATAQDTPFYYWYAGGGAEWLAANPSWDNLSGEASGMSWGEFYERYKDDREILPQFGERILKDKDGNHVTDADGNPIFDYQSRDKEPADELTKAGFVGLDGRYLNNAPQSTGCMELTEDGGSGSFYILWSGLYKPMTVGAVPYYTGQYAPENQNGSRRGFAFVTIGTGIEDFTAPARATEIILTSAIDDNMIKFTVPFAMLNLLLFTVIILMSILLLSYVTHNIDVLTKGALRFRAGEWQFRIDSNAKDEFGTLYDSFNDMADSVVNNINEPFIITNMEHEIIYMNDSALRITGKTLDEAVGMPYDEVSIYPRNSSQSPIRALHEGREADVIYQKESGHYYKGIANFILGGDGSKSGYIIVSNDVTEIETARRNADHANQAKSNFLSNMSHEIRTPMNSVIGFTELAFESASLKTKEYLSKIMENSHLLLEIINDILDISKIESGNMTLETIAFDLHKLLANCQSIIYPRAIEKNIEVLLLTEFSLGRKLFGDPLRLRQVLLNLLSNAVKFTDSGLVSLSVKITDLKEDTATLYFEVSDSGIGMTPEQITNIFEPFTQADISTTRKYGGTGLGLTISSSMLDLMNSRLKVESVFGAGTKFSFVVTFKLADETASMPETPNTVDESKKPVFKGTILVIEDNNMNQQVITEHLARVGLQTEIAANGLIGIEKVKQRLVKLKKPYDLIFIDIHMPVMDGTDAAPQIIKLSPATPIIAMTADVLSESREKYIKLGMTDYLGKPFTSQELWDCLLRYLTPLHFDTYEDNSDAIQNKLRTDFAKSNQDTFDEITSAIDAADIKRAHRLAHTLKSSAGLIGKSKLQKAAADVESALKNGKNMLTETDMSIFSHELEKVLNELMPLIAETKNDAEPNSPVQDMDEETARELFDKLEQLLSSGSPECLGLVDALRRVPGTEELIAQMEDFYFGAAAETLAALREARDKV